MSENRRSEGRLITLQFCTAASNIPAGTPVAIGTATSIVCTLGRACASLTSTAAIGHHFVGILDEAVSAGQVGLNVWVEGVFELTASTAWTTSYVGDAVFADSGIVCMNAGAGQSTGDAPIGSYIPAGGGERSGRTILVNIRPMVWRWNSWGKASDDASGIQGGTYPRNL